MDAYKGTVQPPFVAVVVEDSGDAETLQRENLRSLVNPLAREHGKFWKSSCLRIEGSCTGSY